MPHIQYTLPSPTENLERKTAWVAFRSLDGQSTPSFPPPTTSNATARRVSIRTLPTMTATLVQRENPDWSRSAPSLPQLTDYFRDREILMEFGVNLIVPSLFDPLVKDGIALLPGNAMPIQNDSTVYGFGRDGQHYRCTSGRVTGESVSEINSRLIPLTGHPETLIMRTVNVEPLLNWIFPSTVPGHNDRRRIGMSQCHLFFQARDDRDSTQQSSIVCPHMEDVRTGGGDGLVNDNEWWGHLEWFERATDGTKETIAKTCSTELEPDSRLFLTSLSLGD